MQKRLASKSAVPDGQKPNKAEFVSDMHESRRLLGSALKGKTVVFVVDDCDLKPETTILEIAVFGSCGASGKSKVITYSDLLSGNPIEADILIARSTRRFEFQYEKIEDGLKRFREGNPRAAVVICCYSMTACERALKMVDSGVINAIENDPPNDYGLLLKASQILERAGGSF